MAQGRVQVPVPKQAQGECPPPPIEHLTGENQPARQDDEYVYDKKTGNPGPRVKTYDVVNQNIPLPQETGAVDPTADADVGPAAIEVPMTDDEGRMYEGMKMATMLFPEVSESWLRKCLELRMIQDKWDLNRAIAYIFENENIAPRKPVVIRPSGHENLSTHRENLFNFKHDVENDYSFFAQVKLTEMFPNLSTASIRRVYNDCNRHYMPTAICLAESLEEYFDTQGSSSWDTMKPTEWFWLIIKRDGRRFKYPMQVVKGMKCWSKKKGRTLGFPRILFEELKLVDTYITKFRNRLVEIKKKRVDEEAYEEAVREAKLRGEAAECPVCQNDYRTKEDAVTCSAGHEFCKKCLRAFCWEVVAGQMKLSLNGEVDCFDAGCSGKFTYRMLEKSLEPMHMARIDELHLGNIIMAANLENVIRCAYCSYVAVVETPVEVDKVFACLNPKCLRQICRLCGDPWKGHEGRGCKPKELSDEQLSRMKFEEAMTSVLTRTCGKCKGIIVKQGGCNKVTCQCGGTICYVCRAPGIGYPHFCQHRREPGITKCNVDGCGGCALYEDTTKRDQDLMRQMRSKFEMDRLAKLDDANQRAPTPSTAAPATGATGAAATAPAAAAAPNAQAAFQRQFG